MNIKLPTMKKRLSFVFALLCAIAMQAQNVQLHYDFGRAIYNDPTARPNVTSTVEWFKLDRWGSTFMFTDLDYFSNGTGGAYMEISHEFNLDRAGMKQWAAHVEYNGGFNTNRDNSYASRYQHAFLLGPAWNWHNSDFSATFSAQLMYKYYLPGHYSFQRAFNSFQATIVWSKTFCKGMGTFSGFADLWYDHNNKHNINKKAGSLVFLSEPQLWFNFDALKGLENTHLSVGTELELSQNFVYTDDTAKKFRAIPTLALKWTWK